MDGLPAKQCGDVVERPGLPRPNPTFSLSLVLGRDLCEKMLKANCAQAKQTLSVDSIALIQDEVVQTSGTRDVATKDRVEAYAVARGASGLNQYLCRNRGRVLSLSRSDHRKAIIKGRRDGRADPLEILGVAARGCVRDGDRPLEECLLDLAPASP